MGFRTAVILVQSTLVLGANSKMSQSKGATFSTHSPCGFDFQSNRSGAPGGGHKSDQMSVSPLNMEKSPKAFSNCLVVTLGSAVSLWAADLPSGLACPALKAASKDAMGCKAGKEVPVRKGR